MATKPRQRSASGFYHLFQRGVNLFDIFEDDIDRKFYLNRMQRYALDADVEIHAWCLMSNHVHLLLRASLENLSSFMRRLGSVFARRFNSRHGRTGPLFECRFGSVCVETDAQLLAVLRYIHRNPFYHDETALFGDYRWSSYSEYTSGEPVTCELGFVFSLFGSIEELIRFHEQEIPSDLERHMDIGVTAVLRDDEARKRANSALREFGFSIDVDQIGKLAHKMRDSALIVVKRTTGCSLRQLQRLTAIAFSAISSAMTRMETSMRKKPYDLQDCDCEAYGLTRTNPTMAFCAVKGIGFLPAGHPLSPWGNGCYTPATTHLPV